MAKDASSLDIFLDVAKTFRQSSNHLTDQDDDEGKLTKHDLIRGQEQFDDIDVAALASDGQLPNSVRQDALLDRPISIGTGASNQGGIFAYNAKVGPADRLLHAMAQKGQPFAVDNFDDATNQAANRFMQNISFKMIPETRGNSANGIEAKNPVDKVAEALVNRPRNTPLEQSGIKVVKSGFDDIGLEPARSDRLKFQTIEPKDVPRESPLVRGDKSSESNQRFPEFDQYQLRRENSRTAPFRSKKKGPTRGVR